ncbi:phospholipid carrier-dependent glycosyltransferase [Candidatus Woesebacteria bacterium]|nr:MAG: phospholipid carrier-dependent glycosyltransferase [Candidatus Woesebacteria bacterium]
MEKFTFFPPINDTADEYKAPFNGLSLIKDKVPSSWSFWDDYGDFPMVTIRGTKFRMVKPWFDEPPGFGLLTGGYLYTKGIYDLENVDVGLVRYPMIKLATLSIFILFIVVWLTHGYIEALLASMIYATVPTFVLSSRLVLSENMIAFSSMLSILLLLIYTKRKNIIVLLLLSFVSASSLMYKTPGIFVPIAVFGCLFALKYYKQSLVLAGTIFLFVFAWFVYGYFYNIDIFLKIINVSSGRELYLPGNIFSLFVTYRIGEKVMDVDGWIIFGWISAFAIGIQSRERRKINLKDIIIPVFLGSYLVFFFIMSGHSKGWYRIPFYPFLAWAMADVIINVIKKPKLLSTFFVLTVPFASSYIYGTGEKKFGLSEIRKFQYTFVGLLTPPMLYELTNNNIIKRIVQVILVIFTIIALHLNIKTIINFQDQFWY